MFLLINLVDIDAVDDDDIVEPCDPQELPAKRW